jgi:hypothetical protein
METSGDLPEGDDPQVVLEEGVHGSEKVVHPEAGCDLKICDLAFGVDAGIRPARSVDGDQMPRDLE